jgi:FG-GAP repeat
MENRTTNLLRLIRFAGAPNLAGDFDGGTSDDGRVFALTNNGVRRLGVVDLYTTTPNLEVRSWLNQQHIGQAFASGDLNGDGKRDLMIGASGAAQFNVTGTVYVFTGGVGLSGVRTLSPTMQAAYRFRSNQNTSSFGGANSLAAGHLHLGGTDDLVVGEANATVPGRSQAGAVYVFFGNNSLPSLWDMRVLSPSLTIYGLAANAQLGRVAVADVNGDGQPDLIARYTSTLNVFYGPLAPGVIDLASTPASLTVGGLADGLLAAGDVDGDGKADIIVGSCSQVIVLRGSTGAVMVTYTGVTASALHTLDLNGDGKAEIAIGEQTRGRAFIVHGSAALSGSADILERADEIVYGEKSSDQFGFSLGSGDLDGDGTADLIIGSRTHGVTDHPLHFEDAGAVYVLYGQGRQQKLYLPLVTR